MFDLANVLGKVADKFIPDASDRNNFKLSLEKLQQDGAFRELDSAVKLMLAEANSSDPWTSRARPSFLYVMYVMILAAIPMGLLFAFKPDVVTAVINGMKLWLEAIPGELYALFGAGYLGYTRYRSKDKENVIAAKTKSPLATLFGDNPFLGGDK